MEHRHIEINMDEPLLIWVKPDARIAFSEVSYSLFHDEFFNDARESCISKRKFFLLPAIINN